MSASGPKNAASFGFLTVVSSAEHGLFGGYLVLNAVGRPLEFHCTAPVKANRAQEILFGNSLKPFLYGEQIGQTLVGKSKMQPKFICTDESPVMAMRPYVTKPMALVGAGDETTSEFGNRFSLAGVELAVGAEFADDERLVREAWEPCAGGLDLGEPFQRIREAIEEAQRGKRAA